MKKKRLLIFYFLISLVWIYGTNYILQQFPPSHIISIITRIKEIIYVITSGCVFYFFIKKTEELHSSNEDRNRLSTLINSMVDFVTFKDGEGRWIEANEFGLKLFQLEHVDYRGKKNTELAAYTDFYAEALKNGERSDEEAWRNGNVTRVEEDIPQPNGTFKTFDTIKTPIFYEDGSRKGLVIIGRDITKLRDAEDRLRRTEKLSVVGELSASVAHEIRNPLTSLKGFVQLLQIEDKKHHNYFQIMLDELNRINHIVDELLLLAKPQHMKFQMVDIVKLLLDVIALLNTEASMYNIQIEFHSTPKELWMECEPNQLKQLFINLIKNAIDASTSGNKVSIVLEALDQENVSIKIIDFGIGMSKERLEKIGEPFYSSKEKGTGLGLTVSFKIVQSHHGTIHFESEKGNGTSVHIVLPIEHDGAKEKR